MALSAAALEVAFLAELFQGGPNRCLRGADRRPPGCPATKVAISMIESAQECQTRSRGSSMRLPACGRCNR
jgi:hypothetical protein